MKKLKILKYSLDIIIGVILGLWFNSKIMYEIEDLGLSLYGEVIINLIIVCTIIGSALLVAYIIIKDYKR